MAKNANVNGRMIGMSMHELDRPKVTEAVAEARLMPWPSADRIKLSRRQVERLVSRYRRHGAAGSVARKRCQRSNHQLPARREVRSSTIIRAFYGDFGPTRASAKLLTLR